jgi:hypothetical protein
VPLRIWMSATFSTVALMAEQVEGLLNVVEQIYG